MRLFVAIDIPFDVKAELWYLAQRLEHQAKRARIVPLENFHLTLLFIGETNRVNEAREALHHVQLPEKPLDLEFDGVGSFRQKQDYTWWVGIKATSDLSALASSLSARFREAGFAIDTRSFKPHITLARKVASSAERPIGLYAPMHVVRAERLSLMRSTNEGGSMVYTEIDSVELPN